MDEIVVRPFTLHDVDASEPLTRRAFDAKNEALGRERTPEPTPQRRALGRRRVEHLVQTDPEGAWAAELDGRLVGIALALRRGRLWGLSLLAVEPDVQGRGLGRRLLEPALDYADGCDRAVILSSADPRAMRRYFRAGFALHPQVELHGRVDRAGLAAPAADVREGDANDLDLSARVDTALRGADHIPDLQLVLELGLPLFVVDSARGRGYGVARDGSPLLVGATSVPVAVDLLTACLATAGPDRDVEIDFVTAGNDWAVGVGLDAGLALRPGGPVFWRGLEPPVPYLPSGAYL